MKKKKVPLRICVSCREKKEKRELLRIIKTPEGVTEVDRSGKKSGRGAYICSKQSCLQKALNSNILQKNLQADLSEEVIENIKEQLEFCQK